MKAARYSLAEGRAASNDAPKVLPFSLPGNRAEIASIRRSLVSIGIRAGLLALAEGDFASYRDFLALTDKAASWGPCHG